MGGWKPTEIQTPLAVAGRLSQHMDEDTANDIACEVYQPLYERILRLEGQMRKGEQRREVALALAVEAVRGWRNGKESTLEWAEAFRDYLEHGVTK